MKPPTFPRHERPNASRLEAFREEIIAMRKQHWPHDRIAQWLFEEKALRVSGEAVRQFCQSRRIAKGAKNVSKPKETPREIGDHTLRKFEFDDSQPLQTRKNL